MAGAGDKSGDDHGFVPSSDASRLGAGLSQWVFIVMLAAGNISAAVFAPAVTGAVLILTLQIGFLFAAAWRVMQVVVALTTAPQAKPPSPVEWPHYTILVALHDEADIAPQLIDRLAQIDYPPDRLEAFLLLETHDLETLDACMEAEKPDWMQVMVVPAGSPKTKPRALNFGLARAHGEIITIYDAEDDPDPLQLREAASRFAHDATERLACLQAPLRIRTRRERAPGGAFLDRQFAIEYAGLFEVTLPAMARLDLPFPLGGTSNHFRADALRAVGGWDAWNVTEDADLGFRMWREGWRMGVIARPTYETSPGAIDVWLPQRTRWLKGYMQTWGVHTRHLGGMGWRGWLSLVMTIGLGLVSALLHAASLAWVVASVVMAIAAGVPPTTPLFAVSVLVLGAAAAWITGMIGARRAGVAYSAMDMIMAPAYWSMLSLAFLHAAWRLVSEPHAWDKTKHQRDPIESEEPSADLVERAAAGRRAA